MPELKLPVEAHGHVRFDAPSGRTLELIADGDVLRLDVPTWTDLRSLSPASWSRRSAALRYASGVLSTFGLTFELQSKGRTFLELGADVRPNWLARIAGLRAARLSTTAIGLFFRR